MLEDTKNVSELIILSRTVAALINDFSGRHSRLEVKRVSFFGHFDPLRALETFKRVFC